MWVLTDRTIASQDMPVGDGSDGSAPMCVALDASAGTIAGPIDGAPAPVSTEACFCFFFVFMFKQAYPTVFSKCLIYIYIHIVFH